MKVDVDLSKGGWVLVALGALAAAMGVGIAYVRTRRDAALPPGATEHARTSVVRSP